VSDVGFFPGKVKHSNEIMVFLGEGYFVQRTAHECQPIIDRRKLKLTEQLEALKSTKERDEKLQETLLKEDDSKTKWTDDGLLDIREDYEEAKAVVLESQENDSEDDDFNTQL